jgi:dihydrofolate reductase
MNLSMIVAVDNNGGIGFENGLPWHCPEDFAYFKSVTLGQTLVMGMNTYKSLPMYPKGLPGRTNLVICRYPINHPENDLSVVFVTLEQVKESIDKAWLIGGAKTYELLKEQISMLSVTTIEAEYICDTFIDLPKYIEGKTLVEEVRLADKASLSVYIKDELVSNYAGNSSLT